MKRLFRIIHRIRTKTKLIYLSNVKIKKGKKIWSWRDGSEVKRTDCSFRGPRFNPQATTVHIYSSRGSNDLSRLHWHQAGMWYKDICLQIKKPWWVWQASSLNIQYYLANDKTSTNKCCSWSQNKISEPKLDLTIRSHKG